LHASDGCTWRLANFGARQGGFLLDSEQRIKNGVAQVYYSQRGGEAFGAAAEPTDYFTGDRQRGVVAGVELELIAATGQTYAQLHVWHERESNLFSGENFYKSWPNLYAIRGTPRTPSHFGRN
jgi:uncharacterized sulfatase